MSSNMSDANTGGINNHHKLGCFLKLVMDTVCPVCVCRIITIIYSEEVAKACSYCGVTVSRDEKNCSFSGKCLAMQYMLYCLLLVTKFLAFCSLLSFYTTIQFYLDLDVLLGPRQVPIRRALEMHVRKP